MTTDPDRDCLAFDFEFRMNANVVLHAAGGIQRIVCRREGRHDFIADGLDHGAVILLCCRAHDLNAGEHHVASTQIPHDLVDPGAADHVGKQNG
jgi:hypothetical protein